jgi:hypothetical protein
VRKRSTLRLPDGTGSQFGFLMTNGPTPVAVRLAAFLREV